jgi:NAD+ diphosphatase
MTERSPISMRHIAPQTVLNRMGEKRGDKAWLEAQLASPDARFFLLIDLKLAIASAPDRTNTRLRFFTAGELRDAGIDPSASYFLGVAGDGAPVFALALTPVGALLPPGGPSSFEPLVDLRSLAIQSDIPPEELTLAAQARSLAHWHATQRCCGRCGARTELCAGGWRRDCWACGQAHFPRSDPAVIMLITHNGRCLMGHEPRFPENMYSVLAGFVEPGDDIETAVRREVMEEAGVRVGEVAYVASQHWPFPHSLMIACWGEALNADLTLDPGEIADARWFGREEVWQMLERRHPLGHFTPPPLSVSHTLIRAFAEGKLG